MLNKILKLLFVILLLPTASLTFQTRRGAGQRMDTISFPIKSSASNSPQSVNSCQLQGEVGDCCNCTFGAVENMNLHHVHPILTSLVKTAFFRFFKVNIHCECPFWPDDSMCSMQSCSVCECDPNEVPSLWLQAEERSCRASNTASSSPLAEQSQRESLSDASCSSATCAAEEDSRVDRGLDPTIHASLLNLRGWRGYNNPWMSEGPEGEEERNIQFVNLLTNPERYTGYKGEHAHRIWKAIYSQEAFSCLGPDCSLLHVAPQETRVFYRLISGMHTSISVHLTAKFPLEEQASVFGRAGGTNWGFNLVDFHRRLGSLKVKDRVENLYFAFLFVLRAVIKAGPLLERFHYETGVTAEDDLASKLIRGLVRDPSLHDSCPVPFDEGRLWKGHDAERLKAELQAAFINITSIMDCVGCEKCKLWGKLQTLGLATALKILFSSPGCGSNIEEVPQLHLERNEVIALVNLLERFSASLVYYREMSNQLQSSQTQRGETQRPFFLHKKDFLSASNIDD